MNEQDQKEKLIDEEVRGEQIRAFLGNDAVKTVFRSLEQSYFETFRKASTPSERETLHARVAAFDDLVESLERIAASGERATQLLKELERDNDQI